MTGISFTPKFPISPYVAPALVNYLPKTEGNNWYFNTVNKVACEVWGVELKDLLSKNRERHLVRARAFCFEMLKKHTTYTLVAIGKKYNRDHTTVLHNARTVELAKEGYDPAFLEELQTAEKLLIAQFQ